jgi:hypothetical protein
MNLATKEPDVFTYLFHFLMFRLPNGVFIRIQYVLSRAKQVQ